MSMDETNDAVGERWRHKKRGTVYEKIGVAELQCATGQNHGEGEGLVIYRGEDGKLWARLADEFHDGRFEPVATPPAPSVAGAVEPIAVIGKNWSLLWATQGSLSKIVERTGLKIGSLLYAHPPVATTAPDKVVMRDAAVGEVVTAWEQLSHLVTGVISDVECALDLREGLDALHADGAKEAREAAEEFGHVIDRLKATTPTPVEEREKGAAERTPTLTHLIEIPLAYYEWLATIERDVRVADLTPPEIDTLRAALAKDETNG